MAAELSKHRSKVLVISTDPAHNLSDAFDQKFGRDPTLVHGFDNLFCMEIDPKASMQERSAALETQAKALEQSAAGSAGAGGGFAGMLSGMGLGSIAKDIGEAIPGIDEALAFGELLKSVVGMEHEVIVFDTAPTGHTLRMLQFPDMIRKATGIMEKMEKSMGGLFQMARSMMGGGAGGGLGGLFGQLGALQGVVDRVSEQFKDRALTTFVAVCIPEFLSVYETERLVQELGRQRIDCRNIVVNQCLYVESKHLDAARDAMMQVGADKQEGASVVELVRARRRMQAAYLRQIDELYPDMHVCRMPLMLGEVRGASRLKAFGEQLTRPHPGPDPDDGRSDRTKLEHGSGASSGAGADTGGSATAAAWSGGDGSLLADVRAGLAEWNTDDDSRRPGWDGGGDGDDIDVD